MTGNENNENTVDTGGTSAGHRHWPLVVGALVLVLVPVLLSPVLPTQDGPSHLYNAFLAGRLEAGDPRFAPFLELGPGLWPNRFGHYVLLTLGPLVGWTGAERVVAVLASSLPLLAVALWSRHRAGEITGAVLAVGLWMAGSWFFWKGFYDFSISLAPFLGTAVAVDRLGAEGGSSGWRGHGLLQAMLALTLVAHLFTFAVTLALVAFVLAWRWWRGEIAAPQLAAVLPGAVVLGLVLAEGATGGGGMAWYPWADALGGLADADWATAILERDRWAGRAITAGLLAAPFLRLRLSSRGTGPEAAAPDGADPDGADPGGRGDRRPLRSLPTPFEVFALLAFLASVLVPARVGTGQYLPERLRLLALLLLTPSAAAVALRIRIRARIRARDPERGRADGSEASGAGSGAGAGVRWARWSRWIVPALGVLLAGGFLYRGLETVRHADRLEADLRSMDRALRDHGSPPGSWITATHWDPFGPFHRIGVYIHLHDRLAVEHELVVLDNYEARMPIFPVGWRELPNRPEFHRVRAGERLAWLTGITAGERPWVDPVLVLHETRFPLITRSPRLETGPVTAPTDHAVTELRWIPGS